MRIDLDSIAHYLAIFDLRPSEMGLALDDEWQIAEAASGYTKDILISPVHAAAMAAAIVNGGKLMAPHIVESMVDGANKPLYQSEIAEAYNKLWRLQRQWR